MDQQTLLYIMTAFVIIAGVALLLQLGFLFGIYHRVKMTEQKVQAMFPKIHAVLPKVEALVDTSQKAVEQSRQHIADVVGKTNEILDVTKQQLVKVDDVITDATTRAKVQLQRAEMILDDTLGRAHETVATVHHGIIRPVREIHGIVAGVRSALTHLARGNRPSVDRATHDEEMFI
jgi:ABC-type transporter Mla subunit MlaD